MNKFTWIRTCVTVYMFWFCRYFRGLFLLCPANYRASVWALLSLERGVRSSGINGGSKWPVKSKPVWQEVPSMPLLILALCPAPHFSLTAPPPPRLPHLLLSLSHPSGEMPCVSSTVQRKPKTRKIPIKGVSQQPDINILLVCRAESKPRGICGFTRVCVSVCAWVSVYSLCCMHL